LNLKQGHSRKCINQAMTHSAQGEKMDLRQHLIRQMAFSHATFGPGARTAGVCDHIRKELKEVEDVIVNRYCTPAEWTDVVILALDGLTRSLAYRDGDTQDMRRDPETVAAEAISHIAKKQTRNEARTWPDWRTAPTDKAIEHDRTADV